MNLRRAVRPGLWRALYASLLALAVWQMVDLGWQRRWMWRTQLVDKGIGGDGLQYWQMAIHLQREHMVSLDGKHASWLRLPGYPALLRYTTDPQASDEGRTDPKSIQRRVDAWLRRAVTVNLLVDLGIVVAAALLAVALGGGPFAVGAAFVWAWQPWSSVVAIHTLSDPLATLLDTLSLAALARGAGVARTRWFLVAGALAGLSQYVRPDAIFLVPAIAVGGLASPGRRRLARALVGVLAWAVVFAPWPVRNYRIFGEAHPLGALGIDDKGKPIDRDRAYAWLRTWAIGREQETVDFVWRFPGQMVRLVTLPHQAYDTVDEYGQVRDFLRDYNARAGKLDEALNARLEALTAARTERHRADVLWKLPLARIRLRLLPPRDGYGMGTLPTIKENRATWEKRDRRVVAAGLAGLALLLLRARQRAAALAMTVFLVGRLALVGWIPAPEPRYVLAVLALLAATGATVPMTILVWLWGLVARLRRSARPTAP